MIFLSVVTLDKIYDLKIFVFFGFCLKFTFSEVQSHIFVYIQDNLVKCQEMLRAHFRDPKLVSDSRVPENFDETALRLHPINYILFQLQFQ